MIPYTNRQRYIYEQVSEASKLLGIPTPTVLIAYVDGTPKELLRSRGCQRYDYLGYAFQKTNEIYMNPTSIKQSRKLIKENPKYYNHRHNQYYKIYIEKFGNLRHVICHELIHIAFPDLRHGDRFEESFVGALMDGHMVFYKHGKVEMIVTQVTEPVAEVVDKEISKLQIRRKVLETRRKRTETAIKKIGAKIKRLERKIRNDHSII